MTYPPSTERPLAEVLAYAWSDFAPRDPCRAPWHQPTLRGIEVAATGNVAVVPLEVADRAHLRGLGRPSDEQDWENSEPWDWMPAGWGVSPS